MLILNEVTISGVLYKDAEKKETQNGTPKALLIVETPEEDRDGNKKHNSPKHRVLVFGSIAERAHLLKEGTNVFVRGKIIYRSWTDENNIKRYVTEILARDFQVIGIPKQELS